MYIFWGTRMHVSIVWNSLVTTPAVRVPLVWLLAACFGPIYWLVVVELPLNTYHVVGACALIRSKIVRLSFVLVVLRAINLILIWFGEINPVLVVLIGLADHDENIQRGNADKRKSKGPWAVKTIIVVYIALVFSLVVLVVFPFQFIALLLLIQIVDVTPVLVLVLSIIVVVVQLNMTARVLQLASFS